MKKLHVNFQNEDGTVLNGYIDGYTAFGMGTDAIIYCPIDNKLYSVDIDSVSVIEYVEI